MVEFGGDLLGAAGAFREWLEEENTTPLLGVLVSSKGFKPGKATSLVTPSTFMAISVILFSTASVRSMDAPSGIFTPATRYCLSCTGMKPAGTALNITPVASSNPV